MLLRMFSTDVAEREEQPSQVPLKQPLPGVPVQESKKLAGKVVRLEQFNQARVKIVPLDVSINGKLVRLEQPYQVLPKLVPLEVLINGKLVKLVQLRHVSEKLVPLDVSIRGKLVRLLLLYQA